MTPAAPRRALVFSGGGARGAYEAGVLRYLLDELPQRLGHPPDFRIVCGTSVGAIHACYVAAGADLGPGAGGRLVDFWTTMKIEETLPFTTRDVLGLPRRLLGLRRTAESLHEGEAPARLYGLLDTSALERRVIRSIPWRRIRARIDSGSIESVCVAATQIATGHVVLFIESSQRELPPWTRDPHLIPRLTHLLPMHALASAAMPLLFPAVRVGSTYYADGGLRLNTPLVPALRLGAERILVIATRQDPSLASEAALADQHLADYSSPFFLYGKMLNALFLDPLDTDLIRLRAANELVERGERAYGPDFVARLRAAGPAERPLALRRIEHLTIRPSADLGRLAGQTLLNMSEARQRSALVRFAARNLGEHQRTPESDLLSYLLFDGEFVAPLTELGLCDARAREEELVRFFRD